MADNEIAEMVDAGWLAGVKASDPHPVIKAFVVGHEGESDILLAGTPTPVSWVKRAVGWLADKIGAFTPVFYGHGAPGDNSQLGRVPVGYVVGKKLVEMGQKTAAIAAMYIFPQYKNLSFDVASIEANIGYERYDGTVRPTFIEKITAVALGNSATSTPGFPGATLIGVLQAFADGMKRENGMAITRDEVKKAVAELGIKPSDLFTVQDLEGDSGTKRFVDEAKHDVYNQNVRLQTELNDARKRAQQETESHAAEVKRLKGETVMAKSQGVMANIISERKLPDKQAAFVNLRMRSFKSEAQDDAMLRADLNRYIDEVQAEYVEVLKSQGIDPATVMGKPPEGGTKTEDKPKTTPPQEAGYDSNPLDDLDNPKTNPLLAT